MGFEDFIRERAAVKYAERQKDRDFQHAEKEADRQNARDLAGMQGANQLAVGAQGAASHEKIAGMNNAAHVRGIETGGQYQLAGKAMDNQGAMDRELTRQGFEGDRDNRKLAFEDAWKTNDYNIRAAQEQKPKQYTQSQLDKDGNAIIDPVTNRERKITTLEVPKPLPDMVRPNVSPSSEPRQISSTPAVSYAPAPVTIQRDVAPALAAPGGGYRSVYQPPAAPAAPVGSQPGTRADALFGVGRNGLPMNAQPVQPVPVNTIQGPNGTVFLTNRQGAQASATGVPPVAQPTAPATQPTPAPAPQQTPAPAPAAPASPMQPTSGPAPSPAPALATPPVASPPAQPAPAPTASTPWTGRDAMGRPRESAPPSVFDMAPDAGRAVVRSVADAGRSVGSAINRAASGFRRTVQPTQNF